MCNNTNFNQTYYLKNECPKNNACYSISSCKDVYDNLNSQDNFYTSNLGKIEYKGNQTELNYETSALGAEPIL